MEKKIQWLIYQMPLGILLIWGFLCSKRRRVFDAHLKLRGWEGSLGSSSFLRRFVSAFPTTSLFCHAWNILIGTQLCNLNQTPCCISPSSFSIIWFILVPKWLSSLLYHFWKSATALSCISDTLLSSVGLKVSAAQMQPLTFFSIYVSKGLLLRVLPLVDQGAFKHDGDCMGFGTKWSWV